jgi:hypothetical protein
MGFARRAQPILQAIAVPRPPFRNCMEVSRIEACASVVPLKIQFGCNDLGSGAMQSSNRWSPSARRRIVNNNENEQITAVMVRGRTGSRPRQRAAQAGDRGTIREFQFHESTDLRGRVKARSVGWVELLRYPSTLLMGFARKSSTHPTKRRIPGPCRAMAFHRLQA